MTRKRSIVFLVTLPASQDPVVIVEARNREQAKRYARNILRHDPERYIVQPLTQAGAEVHVMVPPTIRRADPARAHHATPGALAEAFGDDEPMFPLPKMDIAARSTHRTEETG